MEHAAIRNLTLIRKYVFTNKEDNMVETEKHILQHAATGILTLMGKYVFAGEGEEDKVVEKNMKAVDMWKEFNCF